MPLGCSGGKPKPRIEIFFSCSAATDWWRNVRHGAGIFFSRLELQIFRSNTPTLPQNRTG
jgi:hypothetical protein